MQPELKQAQTRQQQEAVYRFRYEVYVEEMGRYRTIADHSNRFLREDVDDKSRLWLAMDGDKVVGTMRFTWGGDAPFIQRHIKQYDLQPWLERVPADQLVVGERFMVATEHRGTDLLFRMFKIYMEFVNAHRIQLIFGDCEPHLLNLYQGLGFRTYTKRNINSPETGYLIPLIMVAEDLDYMKNINSPLLKVLTDFGEQARVPSAVRELSRETAVFSQRLSRPDEYWSHIYGALNNAENSPLSPFDGMDEEKINACLSKSSVIECANGDRILKKGNVARNMFIVLSGTLEARDGDHVLGAPLITGDVFGEMAFLLGMPRSADVYAVSDDVRVLSLSESEIRKIIDSDPEVAATLMLNVSKMLCRRVLNLMH